ncbi:MAG: replication-associated recombination protein A [Candidatus Omnitrophota bacterium]
MQNQNTPLATRLRPKTLDEFVGQSHLLGENKLLRRVIISKKVPSLILYGPAGCGKTTLGFIIASTIDAGFEYLNAAFTSTQEVRKVLKQAKDKLNKESRKTILFIDEIHRFNKLQQETLVPDTESGGIIFIGATIYNPHYYLINSMISRSIVANFKPLSKEDIQALIKRALTDKENGLAAYNVDITDQALDHIAIMASGDARKALSGLEVAAFSTQKDSKGRIIIDLSVAKESIQKYAFYDRKQDYHYDTISAFIKSMRGSDVDSALYWLAKMLKSGEDPRFIARRMTILASEDIGNADPFALVLATSCFKAVEFVGSPEANLILAQTVIYLACSPKSNSVYKAISKAESDVEAEETQEVPSHIKTHAKSYKYPHMAQTGNTHIGGFASQDYGAKNKYYFPLDVGQEKKLKEFLENIENLK